VLGAGGPERCEPGLRGGDGVALGGELSGGVAHRAGGAEAGEAVQEAGEPGHGDAAAGAVVETSPVVDGGRER
jgi:hypothetical protein